MEGWALTIEGWIISMDDWALTTEGWTANQARHRRSLRLYPRKKEWVRQSEEQACAAIGSPISLLSSLHNLHARPVGQCPRW